jgi:hypothetical protein
MITIDTSIDLFSQLEPLIAQCDSLKHEHPAYVIQQLEEAIVALPLPSRFEHGALKQFKCYEHINDSELLITKISMYLVQLQQLYIEANSIHHSNALYWDTPHEKRKRGRPAEQISHSVLIGLRDFLHFETQIQATTPNHGYNQFLIDLFLSHEHNPYYAANHPVFDEKFEELLSLYRSAPSPSARYNISDWRMASNPERALYAFYKTLITPEDQAVLMSIYNSFYQDKIEASLAQYLNYGSIESLHVLFELFNTYGIFNADYWNRIERHYASDAGKKAQLAQLKTGAVQRFIKQIHLEKYLLKSLIPLSSFERKEYHRPEVRSTNPGYEVGYALKHFKPCPNLRYTFSTFPERFVLEQDTPFKDYWLSKEDNHQYSSGNHQQLSANRIQLSAYKAGLKKPILFVRDLLHLRSAPSYQVQLTLDYFKQNIHTLSDKDTQTYVEAKLLERNLLNRLLHQNEKECVAQIDEFIQRGLHHFLNQQSLLTDSSLFFIHLRFLVNQYLMHINPELAYKRLKANGAELSAWIDLPHDDGVKAGLHQYRFLSAIKLYEQQHDSLDTECKEVLFVSSPYRRVEPTN